MGVIACAHPARSSTSHKHNHSNEGTCGVEQLACVHILLIKYHIGLYDEENHSQYIKQPLPCQELPNEAVQYRQGVSKGFAAACWCSNAQVMCFAESTG